MASEHDTTEPELLIDESMDFDLAEFKHRRMETGNDYEALFSALMMDIFQPAFYGPESNQDRQVVMRLQTQSGGPDSAVEIGFKVEQYDSDVLRVEDMKYRFTWDSKYAVREIKGRNRGGIEKAVENLMAEDLFEPFLTYAFGEDWKSEVIRQAVQGPADAEDFEATVDDVVNDIADHQTIVEVDENARDAIVESGRLAAKLKITYDGETLQAEKMIVSFDDAHPDWPRQSKHYDCGISNLPQIAMDAVIEHEGLEPDGPAST